jgi:hypothetical protein
VLSCSGADDLSTVHVTIHLTKADVVGKEWRATAFEGTETVYTAAQLGCVSSNVAYAVSGTLAR